MNDEIETLAEAKEWLRERWDDGVACPCCTQMVKVYHRSINVKQALAMISMAKEAGQDYVHVPSLEGCKGDGCEVSRLRYWGLVEEATEPRGDGGRAGWWRLTDLGWEYIHGRVQVPLHAVVFDSRCLGMEGDPVGIRHALDDKFDLRELMSG